MLSLAHEQLFLARNSFSINQVKLQDHLQSLDRNQLVQAAKLPSHCFGTFTRWWHEAACGSFSGLSKENKKMPVSFCGETAHVACDCCCLAMNTHFPPPYLLSFFFTPCRPSSLCHSLLHSVSFHFISLHSNPVTGPDSSPHIGRFLSAQRLQRLIPLRTYAHSSPQGGYIE